MRNAIGALVLGVISFVVGLTSTDERAWTWPFMWLGLVLIVVGLVLTVIALRGRRGRA